MTNKKNVIAIVGDSGSGKTFASMYLQEMFGWEAIVSYTTRPMRKGERNGREHWFVKPSQVPPQEKMCAYTNSVDMSIGRNGDNSRLCLIAFM